MPNITTNHAITYTTAVTRLVEARVAEWLTRQFLHPGV